MPKFITSHSYSSINTFETCPRQFEAKYITKTLKFIKNVASEFGDRVHKSLENRLTKQAPLSEEAKPLEPLIVAVSQFDGTHYTERGLAITRDLQPTTMYSAETWLNGKADFMTYNEATGYLRVLDWKTGNPKTDMLQLKIMALLAMCQFPSVTKIRAAFVYTKTGEIDKAVIPVQEIPEVVAEVRQKTIRIEHAQATNNFPPQPSGLCRSYCGVTTCQFYQKGRY
jgi:RecB family exonuclease